ncbi:hypothetical protein P43SY_009135 [Pythium insidiosum]|uniref:Uncharacterized protein n=1 Tax=Pythium insidiosum TaxID=114742 RepID=A0AAD5Q7Z2_PYTIN|nr:hypothetical protein P43SY_009135 [Pythium insidiosum]
MADSKYALRSGGSGAAASGRSPWRAMDLHTTTTTSSVRRAMNVSAGATSASATPPSTGQNAAGPQQPKPRSTEDSALSARNLLLRHKLSERKRFDSADYAMKKVRQVMDASSARSDVPDLATTTASAPSVGATVFRGALRDDGDVDMTPHDDANTASMTTTPPARRYGALTPKSSATDMSVLSARNIVIQRQLAERRQFDSADYQLAQLKRNAVSVSPPADVDMALDCWMDAVNSPLPTSRVVHPLSDEQTMSPSGSPLRATVVEGSTDVSQRASKYAGLSGADEVLRRKLAEKKRFDSADYNMAAAVSMAAQASSRMQPKHQFFPAAPSPREMRASPGMSAAVQPPPAPLQTPLAVATAGGNGTGYGKLCAANVLIRKKLKERKRFDSADYSMAQAGVETDMEISGMAAGDGGIGTAVSTTPLAGRVHAMAKFGTMQAMNPQAKHMKLSDGSGTRWVAPILAGSTDAQPRYPFATSDAMGGDQDHRLAARNIIIRRKLAERKRFDSADYFVAKKAAEQHE